MDATAPASAGTQVAPDNVWDWGHWLPSLIQWPIFWYTVLVCVAAGYFCRALPKSWQAEPVMPVIVLLVGQVTDYFLIDSHVYALGTGLLASMFSIACYPLFINWLLRKIGQWLPADSSSSTPDILQPGPKLNDRMEK